ncbi:N-acetyltransferase domain-containing protein [Fusarium keratoplasticum]|uniref:N-acetyltransferase domain-containing protein n=1 Tax=Fusarium keratoplasticum TaxID=1328300 RepID=A0ACC0QLV2_9HYPO|nr:N-acetyltransferase domain-containing protein [Fusarium keratoplasticum]KAI8660067.1 N-acetyltransferase domain-containing protein [Fusarium keratoplasticum]
MAYSLVDGAVADLESITRLQFSAFLSTIAIERLVYPAGMTRRTLALAVQAKKRSFNQSHVRYFKVVTDNGQIVAFARWYVWTEDQPETAWGAPFSFTPPEGLPPSEFNSGAAQQYYRGVDTLKKNNIRGRRCLYLSLLATHPTHHGEGCGSTLMNWGMKYAETHALDLYLISSPESLPWYQKFGFCVIDTFSMDMTMAGGSEEDNTSGFYTATLMQLRCSRNNAL